ncbi:MAG: hypothetical protein PHQ40_07965 [Anaerolineaceae bacterium]|nr:hypothetical protein [Anaerolineaceae bacterium]
MKRMNTEITLAFLATGILLASLQGCSIFGAGQRSTPTLSSLSAAVAQTATAAKQSGASTDALATAQAKATQKSLEIQITQTARSGNRSDSQLAIATIAAPIVAEIPQYGLDTTKGRVGWVHDPLVLKITGYQQVTYGNDHMEVTAADFALTADITWDTQYGSSGCGFMFRSNGDKNKPNQYMVLATRFANGHVLFTALADGEIANIHDFYPKTEDRSFAWQNGTKNRLAVIARGRLIEIYTNGVKIGEVDTTKPPTRLPSPPKPMPPMDQTSSQALKDYQEQLKEYQDILKQSEAAYQTAVSNYANRQAIFDDGFLAMIAASESGRTVCTFDNAWLWLIEP